MAERRAIRTSATHTDSRTPGVLKVRGLMRVVRPSSIFIMMIALPACTSPTSSGSSQETAESSPTSERCADPIAGWASEILTKSSFPVSALDDPNWRPFTAGCTVDRTNPHEVIYPYIAYKSRTGHSRVVIFSGPLVPGEIVGDLLYAAHAYVDRSLAIRGPTIKDVSSLDVPVTKSDLITTETVYSSPSRPGEALIRGQLQSGAPVWVSTWLVSTIQARHLMARLTLLSDSRQLVASLDSRFRRIANRLDSG